MKDYHPLSDFEINELVAKATGLSHETYPDFSPEPYVWNEDAKAEFDPCNNPSDAWLIIQENGICIGYDGMSWDASSHLHGIPHVSDWRSYPESPLRMAMIVFLMIQEGKC